MICRFLRIYLLKILLCKFLRMCLSFYLLIIQIISIYYFNSRMNEVPLQMIFSCSASNGSLHIGPVKKSCMKFLPTLPHVLVEVKFPSTFPAATTFLLYLWDLPWIEDRIFIYFFIFYNSNALCVRSLPVFPARVCLLPGISSTAPLLPLALG